MAGLGSRSSDFREAEAEPVYLLTRRRSSYPPPPPVPSRLVVAPAQQEPQPQRDSLEEFTRRPVWYGEPADDIEEEEDVSDIRLVRRFTRRRRGMRALGALAIMGTLAGGAYVLQQPKVRHEALSFVTMGHEDAAARAGRRIASFVDALRHR